MSTTLPHIPTNGAQANDAVAEARSGLYPPKYVVTRRPCLRASPELQGLAAGANKFVDRRPSTLSRGFTRSNQTAPDGIRS